MEVYYKDLISEDASLEKLVDDLVQVVQGADGSAQGASVGLEQKAKEEITSRLQRLKERCRRVEQQAVAGAQAADRALRRYPYSAAGLAFGIGLLIGVLVGGDDDDE
jgi:ElaB/YqjD/DUF883 family membrane-anchored ribosome-binding protein